MKNKQKSKQKNSNKFKFVVHPVTLIFAILSFCVGMFWLFATYIVCLLMHEFSHAIASKKLGYKCKKIVLYPTGALLYGSTDEFTFKDEIIIALAGPICNIFLIIICVFLWWIFPNIYNYTLDFVVANLSLAMFNLLPIFPLDGGRILLAVLSLNNNRKQACKISRNITLCFSILLFIVFLLSCFVSINLQLGVCSIVIFISAIVEDKQACYQRLISTDLKRRKLKHGLKVVNLMFNQNIKLSKLISKIDNFGFYNITIVDDDFKVIMQLTEMQINEIALKCVPGEKLVDAVNRVAK